MPAPNERFGATAAGSADLKGSGGSRRCAKPPSRCRQCGDSAVERMPLEKKRKKTFKKQIIQKKVVPLQKI